MHVESPWSCMNCMVGNGLTAVYEIVHSFIHVSLVFSWSPDMVLGDGSGLVDGKSKAATLPMVDRTR